VTKKRGGGNALLIASLLATAAVAAWLLWPPPPGKPARQIELPPPAVAEHPPTVTEPELPPAAPPASKSPAQPMATQESPPPPVATPQAPAGAIALLIDDIGADLAAVDRLLRLPIRVSLAVMPDTPHAREAAERGWRSGHTILLHMPMEPESREYAARMDVWFLREGMSAAEMRTLLARSLAAVPHAIGINNHMGSRLTAEAEPMQQVMEFCRERDLFFIDSRTSGGSVAALSARDAGLRWGMREIFLDHSQEPAAIAAAWQEAEACAASGQSCIVIGHPHPATLAFLEQLGDSVRARTIFVQDALYTATPAVGAQLSSRSPVP